MGSHIQDRVVSEEPLPKPSLVRGSSWDTKKGVSLLIMSHGSQGRAQQMLSVFAGFMQLLIIVIIYFFLICPESKC